jgi:hypothetical protein
MNHSSFERYATDRLFATPARANQPVLQRYTFAWRLAVGEQFI